MNNKALEKYLSSFAGAESGYPFGDDALVFKVAGKMFALIAPKEKPPRLTLKTAPADGVVLVNMHDCIVPGYHMNKRHWITITLNGELPDAIIRDLAKKSYALVVAGLRRVDKVKIGRIK